MILLQWRGTLRFGPMVRGTFGSQPALVVLCVLFGVVPAVIETLDHGIVFGLVAGVLVSGMLVGLTLLATRRGLSRLRRVHGSADLAQWYTVTDEAMEFALGQDRVSFPLAEVTVVRHGPDWVGLRRRGANRVFVVYMDDRAVVPQLVDLLAQRGARR